MATPRPGELPAGMPAQLDRYQVVSCIGRGGIGQVFHARMQGIGGFERDVALKVLLPEYASEPDFVTMLLDEARIAGALRHPCVVGVLDVGRAGDLFYLVMEYVDGCDLRSLLRAAPGAHLPLPMALYIVSEVLRGLQAVHGAVDRDGAPRRIVHRDVSPANVLVDREGLVKLGDFGIAHAASRITRTRQGAVKGKLRYMAPEQLGGMPVDHRADLYAVGIMLCELLLGIEACEPKRMTPFGPVFAWSPRMAPDRIPADVAAILDRALAEDPQVRYPDAAAFRRDMVAALYRRAPGYGAEDLARDLQAPVASPYDDLQAATQVTEVEPTGLFQEEQKATEPFQPVEPTPPWGTLKSPRAPQWKKLGLVAAVVGASVLSVTLAVLLGAAPSAAASAPSFTPTQIAVASAPVTRPATGKLSVVGPAGARVTIGSTSYPPAPCQVELPAGTYQVKLRRRPHARPIVRQVTIEPGREYALEL